MTKIVAPGSQPLSPQMERYCLGIVGGMSRVEARKAAGYTGTSVSGVYQLAARKDVRARIAWLQGESAKIVVNELAVTRSEVVEGFRENIEAAKLGVDGKRDFSAVNRGYESLGKMHGFMIDVNRDETFDEELDGKSHDELKATVMSLLESLDPNMRKKMIEESMLADVKDSDESVPEGETLQ